MGAIVTGVLAVSVMAVSATAIVAATLVIPATAEGAVSPAAYRVSRLCEIPAPGYSGCLGLRLVARQQGSEQYASTSQPSTSAAQPIASIPKPAGSAGRQAGPSSEPANSDFDREGQEALKKKEYKEPRPGSFSPAEIAGAYDLAGVPAPAKTQTLAIVDAYNDPTVEEDLAVFDEQYSLPECTSANKCFEKVEMTFKRKAPPTEDGWAQEIANDVEVAHGLCPSCKIILVEAYSNGNEELEAAERKAEELGATEISNSWGGPEVGVTTGEDETDAFNDPGTVIAAAAGDEGFLDWQAEKADEQGYPDYPASSPHVVAVGGTRLELRTGGTWKQETIWNGYGAGGGGCSTVLQAPPWQQSLSDWPAVGCESHRAVADVSADADPYTGVSIYDSTPVLEEGVEYKGWTIIGGTSVATPIIAATYALAGGAGTEPDGEAVKYPAQTLYDNLAFDPSVLHEVTEGSNGVCIEGFYEATGLSACTATDEGESCSQQAICVARAGYDGPSGVGTPDGIAAFQPLNEADKQEIRELREREAEERALQAKGPEVEGNAGNTGSSQGPSSAGAPTPPSAGSLAAPTGPILSGLTLTRNAAIALRDGRPMTSLIAFTFTLSLAARVRVTLAKEKTVHGHKHWQTLAQARTIAATRGHNSAKLSGHAPLRPGTYRLTLTPAHGAPRTLVFRVR